MTELIRKALDGASPEAEQSMPFVWEEIRKAAERLMRLERPDHTLEPTALANECFIRLRKIGCVEFADRQRFFGLVGCILRNILVNHARARFAAKRGGDRQRLPLSEDLAREGPDPDDLLDLDTALGKLRTSYPGPHRVVYERFFRRRTFREIAAELGISEASARRRCQVGLAVLLRRLDRDAP